MRGSQYTTNKRHSKDDRKIARHAQQGAVVTSGYKEVHTDEFLVRAGPGRCKCTLCGSEFQNREIMRRKHQEGKKHQEALAKHREANNGE